MNIKGRDLTPHEQEVFEEMVRIAKNVYMGIAEKDILENPNGESVDDFLDLLRDKKG